MRLVAIAVVKTSTSSNKGEPLALNMGFRKPGNPGKQGICDCFIIRKREMLKAEICL